MSTSKARPFGSVREISKKFHLPRSTFYYHPKKPEKDWLLKNQIEKVLENHPAYGHRRIALELHLNKKRILRVMRIFGIKPYRRRVKNPYKRKTLGIVHQNLIQNMPFPKGPNIIWVSDFTRLPFHGRVLYLATIKDIFNRMIVGWSLLSSHSTKLIVDALVDAVEKYGRPNILHSDQGSEYKARDYAEFAEKLGITLSMSHKGCGPGR